jgi:mRNA-degrading endonuclease RelE of RelBE toxin-antitoxin system
MDEQKCLEGYSQLGFFNKLLEKLPPEVARRVLESIEGRLAADPGQYAKKLTGAAPGEGQWRFRVGAYRVRFDYVGPSRLLVFRVRHRREVYER